MQQVFSVAFGLVWKAQYPRCMFKGPQLNAAQNGSAKTTGDSGVKGHIFKSKISGSHMI